MSDVKPDAKIRRGIYLLPNLFTTANLFAGFYAVIAAINGQFEHAAIAIFVSFLLDGVDGRVARLTNTQSDFGAEYDSMSDMVSFGMAPALVVYNWGLAQFGDLGWLAAFIYVAGAALRLARFNTQVGIADKRFFQGLASPSAAAIMVGMVWVGYDMGITGHSLAPLVAFTTALTGILMVSNFRYHSFKEFDVKGHVPFVTLLIAVVAFVVIASYPSVVLFSGFVLYALSGPVLTVRRKKSLTIEDVVGDSEDADFEDELNKKQ